MKAIIIYLLFLLVVAISGMFYIYFDPFLNSKISLQIIFYCITVGLIGGIVNCLRGIYDHFSIKKDWDSDWLVWYFIRPILSAIMGFISFIFIKAGLLVFSNTEGLILRNNIYGFLAVAFVAGFNVKYFLEKIQEIANSVWGIKKVEDYKKDKNV